MQNREHELIFQVRSLDRYFFEGPVVHVRLQLKIDNFFFNKAW